MRSFLPILVLAVMLAGCCSSRTFITDAKTIGPYSPAVGFCKFLYLSGQIGIKPGTTKLAGDDIESQARQALENIKSLLLKGGYEMTDVVQCTVYLKDMSDFAKMNQIYESYFVQGRFPTRTTVEVSNLPAEAKIEITAVAFK
jgi:2-iminobutanoate/2-iminopropanoate deaminase